MGSNTLRTGRHRLGMPNGVHCVQIPAVATALEEHRRNWFTSLVSPARHSFAAMRKRATATASTPAWAPAAGY